MRRIPPISSIMTAFPHSIEIDRPVGEARKAMAEHDIRHLPVMQQGKLVGVVTERDIKLALDPAIGLPLEHELRVRNVCATEAYIVELTEPLDRVLLHMAKQHYGFALVVKGGRLVGIFTMSDACRSFAELLHTLFPRGGDDAA